MEIVKAWEEAGVKIPAPYSRTIKVLFAPDKGGVDELTFSFALLDPGGQTVYRILKFVKATKATNIARDLTTHELNDLRPLEVV